MRNQTTLLIALALAPAFSACVVAAAAVGGVLVSQSIAENSTYVGHLNVDASRAWAQVKVTLSKMSTKPYETDDARRKAVADVDGGTVTALVESYDVGKSILRVSAKEYGFAAPETARIAFEKIVEDLNRTVEGN